MHVGLRGDYDRGQEKRQDILEMENKCHSEETRIQLRKARLRRKGQKADSGVRGKWETVSYKASLYTLSSARLQAVAS